MKFLALVCLIVAVSARPQAPTKFQEDSVSVQPVAVGDPVGFNQERPVVDGQGAPEDGEKRPPQVGGVEADREGRQDGFKPPQEVQTGNVPAQQEDDAEKVEDHDATAPVKPNKSKRQVDEVDVDHDEVKQDDGADNPSDVDAAKEEEKVKPVGGKKKKRQAPVEGAPSENNDDDDDDGADKDEEVKPVKPVSLPAAVDRTPQQGRKKRQDFNSGDEFDQREDARADFDVVPEAVQSNADVDDENYERKISKRQYEDVGDAAAPREDARTDEFVVPEAVKLEENEAYGKKTEIERKKRQNTFQQQQPTSFQEQNQFPEGQQFPPQQEGQQDADFEPEQQPPQQFSNQFNQG